MTLIELLGAIALVGLLSAGAVTLVNGAMEDTRGQHAGRHQSQVVEAAGRYIRENYADLVTATQGGAVAVPIDTLREFLPEGFEGRNAYDQTPCLRLRQPQPGRLSALIVAEGGEPIPAKDLAYVAAHAGVGGGRISADAPEVAQGVFGSWRLQMSEFGGAACSPDIPGAVPSGRLVSALFFDGPETRAVDFLYRGEVPGHPELNAMTVPLALRDRAVVVEDDQTDPLCSAADPLSQGRIGVDLRGAVLSCQNGAWKRQGSAFWKDPVANAAALPVTGNQPGDVRLTRDTSRAFAWNGSAWTALAVDAQGNMRVPGSLRLDQVVAVRDPCSPDGAVSRDVRGLTLSCQSGLWRTQSVTELDPTQSEHVRQIILASPFAPPVAGVPVYGGPMAYESFDDTYVVQFLRPLRFEKNGQLAFNGWATMVRSLISDPTVEGRVHISVDVRDLDTGTLVASSQAVSPRLRNDAVTINTTLSKPLVANTAGYEALITLKWSQFDGCGCGPYNRANYVTASGALVEEMPLQAGWTLDVIY